MQHLAELSASQYNCAEDFPMEKQSEFMRNFYRRYLVHIFSTLGLGRRTALANSRSGKAWTFMTGLI
jgi:hypothetical protein